MQIILDKITPTKAKLIISGDLVELKIAHNQAVNKLGANIKVPGFRPGKAPENITEKYLDANTLAQESLEVAVNDLYTNALIKEQIRPVNNPKIEVKTYVPLEKLDFEAEVDIIGDIKLAKYVGLSIPKEQTKVTIQEINQILDKLRTQLATRKESNQSAKNNNELVIDFNGLDAQTNQPIAGAQGQDYPLLLDSKTFIPGFEEQLLGTNKDDTKEFVITFPSDYGIITLQNKKVKFKVKIKQINQIILPKLDDQFAQLVGDFSTLKELKEDIKKELLKTKQDEALIKQQNLIIEHLVNKTNIEIPAILIDDEKNRIDAEQRKNANYRGLTWQEYLQQSNLNQETYLKNLNQQAETRVKTGLVLGAVANSENLSISKQELNLKIAQLKEQYKNDQQMQQELNNQNNIQDIQNRLLVEKTVNKLVELNS